MKSKYKEKHKIHKVVLYKFVYFAFIYDLQLFKSVILYPKSYVSTVIEAFVPCHQTKRYGNPQRALVERP